MATTTEAGLAVLGWQTLGLAVSKLRDTVIEDVDAQGADPAAPDATTASSKTQLKAQASNAYACRKERERLNQLLEALLSGDVFPKYVTLLVALVEVSQPVWQGHHPRWEEYAQLRQLISQAYDLFLKCKSTSKWDIMGRAQHTQQLAAVRATLGSFGDPARLAELRTAHAHVGIPAAAVELIANHSGKAAEAAAAAAAEAAAAAAAPATAAAPDRFVDYHQLLPEVEATAKRSRRVGIVGIAGVGKTAIARHVFDRIRGRFAGCSLFLTVGRNPDTLVLLRHALAVLLPDVHFTFETAESGRDAIAKELARQELHVLLVLDDIWQQEHIKALDFATAGPVSHQDSRLIITTRHDRTLRGADGTPFVPNLDVLPVPTLRAAHAVALLRAHALPDTSTPADAIETLVESLAHACVPVPLTLQQIGAAVAGRSTAVWEEVLRQLESHDTSADVEARITHQCKVGYEMLSPALQECFLHCAAYPGGARVPEGELEALWAAQAPLPCTEAYTRAAIQLRELLRRRLIMRDNLGLCYVHDTLQQIACMEAAARGGFAYLRASPVGADKSAGESIGGGSRRAMRPGTVVPERSASLTQRARSLWPGRRGDDEVPILHASVTPGAVLPTTVPSGKAVSLRTLLYMRCSGADDLNEAVACSSLRFLSLAGGSFDVLPDAVGDLRMLETLVLRGCKHITKLPERLGDCAELRVLNTAACYALAELPTRLPELTALRKLVVRDCPNLTVPEELGGLTALRVLCAARCPLFTGLPQDVGELEQLRGLNVSHCRALVALPHRLGGASRIEELNLAGCAQLPEIPESIGELTMMSQLNLTGCWALTALPESIGDCSGLRTLILQDCETLAALPGRIGDLSRLESLDISGCTALAALPEQLGGMSHLEMLDASRCSALAALPDRIGDCGRLRVLNLAECAALEGLPERIADLRLLRELNLEQCEVITALPEGIGALVQLQSLNLKWCKGLVEMPEGLGGLQALKTLNLERCYALLSLPESCGDLTSLTMLNLKWCKALMVLPTQLRELRQLEVLNLMWCKCMKALPEEVGALTGLQALVLERCYMLTALPESVHKLGALTALNLKWCKALTSLPQQLEDLQNLRSLNIMHCGTLPPSEVVRAQQAVPQGCVVDANSSALLPQE